MGIINDLINSDKRRRKSGSRKILKSWTSHHTFTVYFRVNGEMNPVSAKKPLGNESVKKETNESGEKLFPQKLQGWPKGWKTLIHGMK